MYYTQSLLLSIVYEFNFSNRKTWSHLCLQKALKNLNSTLPFSLRQDIVTFFLPGLNMDVSFWFSKKKTCKALTHWASENEKLLA